MKIIALGHRRRVGKDTVCRLLMDVIRTHHPVYCPFRIAFADALKEAAHKIFGYAGLKSGAYYDNHADEKEAILPRLGKSPRQIWIEYGNKIREIYAETWIDLALEETHKNAVGIITDLRYPNEADAVRRRDGILIKVVRPEIPESNDIADCSLADFTDWDYVIENCGSMVDLYAKVVKIAEEIL